VFKHASVQSTSHHSSVAGTPSAFFCKKHFLNFKLTMFVIQMLLFETKQRFKKEHFSRINDCAEQGQ
jgi:hypothetical protein